MHPSVDISDHTPPAAPPPRPRLLLTLLCTAQFMLILDISAVNVALPGIGQDLHLDRSTLTWVITAYTLAFGSLMVLGGRLADVIGARRVLLTGLALFTLASALTGLAGSGTALITGRIAQGTGAALLSPAALSIITTTFRDGARTRALAVWSVLAGAGTALGVLLGGVLTAGPGWRWIFYINVPAGALILTVLPRLAAARPGRRGRVDLAGALLAGGGTAALIYGLVTAGDRGWGSPAVLGALTLSAVLYAAFAATERRRANPLLDLHMLTRRPVIAGAFLMLVSTGLLVGFFFLGSVDLQRVHGYSALLTGLLFLPVAAAAGAGAHLGSHVIMTTGKRAAGAAGLTIAAAASALATASGTPAALVAAMTIAALGAGAGFVTATATALSGARDGDSGVASALVSTFHELGASIGVAILSTVAAAGISHGTATGFTRAFTLCAVAAAAAAVTAVYLVPPGRAAQTGHIHAH